MKAIISTSVARFATVCVVALAVFSSCVDHRPLRNEVFNENVYLPKDFLTRENPHKHGSNDHAWLMNVTVVKNSFPDASLMIGDNSSPRYVRFQFAPDKLEMVDDTEYAPQVPDSQGNPVTPHALTPAVLNAWPGSHVDIQMRDNLDGERTNVIEENRERDWQKRQYFKTDLTKAVIPDVNMLAWYVTGRSIGECGKLVNVSLVPGSVEVEEEADAGGDDYLSWTVAVTYEYGWVTGKGWCGDIVIDVTDRHTFTTHLKYSLWRVPKSDYQPVEYDEKDPSRKKLMAFETGIMGRLTAYYDPKTDLWGAKSYMMRLDPQKPHTFYFGKSFPQEHKKHFTDVVAKQVNDMATKLGIKMRIDFKDWNHDGVERTFGDIRYSILAYHNVPWNYGPWGMVYYHFDPRTGEILSGGFNIYKIGDNWYAYMLEEYLKEVTADTFDDTSPLPKSCTPGDTLPIDKTKVETKHKNTSLYNKLETYMGQPAEEWVSTRSEDFGKYMRMLLPDLRYAWPGWNSYVWHASSEQGRKEYQQMLVKDAQFQQLMSSIDRGESPFGTQSVLASGAIETGLASIKQFKEGIRNHIKLQAENRLRNTIRMVEDGAGRELAPSMVRGGRMCKQDGTWETRDEWAQRIVDNWWRHAAVHEFGHTLGLRHNFFGSLDLPHFGEDSISSSIMEYPFTWAVAADKVQFLPHDMFGLRYIYGGADTCGNDKCDPGEEYQSCPKDCKTPPTDDKPWLFCTDEHSIFSPFCTTFDIGTTPTEIIKNEIDYYEWMYKFRNFRTYRKFWNTYSYGNTIFNALYPLRRFLNMWGIDWYASEIKNDLMLLGVTGDQYFFDNITDEFNDEMGQANRLAANFYKAIMQQSAGERSYATKFDTFYGDVTQQGIIMDKYYALFMFIGIWPVDDYDPNIYSYLAYHESSFGNSQYWSDVQDITDSMIGGQYDVYPWFKPLAVLLFAQDTTDIMFSDRAKHKWIQMRRFSEVGDMVNFFGFDPRKECAPSFPDCKPTLQADNPYQVFNDKDGAQWVYYYLIDRDWHLFASKDQNPTSFKILWDQNEDLNVTKLTYVDDYEIKYYLDYFEYFN